MTLPVTTKEFWHSRLFKALATGKELHTIIYDTDYANWTEIQSITASILSKHVKPTDKLLDAGCGYGSIYDVMRGNLRLNTVEYTGVDLSPDLIEIAKIRNPEGNFIEGDLLDLDYKTNYFDVTVLRSIKGMLQLYNKDEEWTEIEKSVSRVSKMLIIIEYENPYGYKLLRTAAR